ncbi:MAG: OsmC family protein [Allosphingosinicella sp.]
MSEHRASLEWRASGDFRANSYSRAHSLRFDGGAVLPASASPAVVPEPMSDPAGVDPEEMLVASVASCHMLWFLDLARRAGHEVERYADDAVGTMGTIEGSTAVARIALRPRIAFVGEGPDAEALARLHRDAHSRCFIANSLKSEVVVEG